MKKTAINPWTWSLHLGYNQAELIENSTRQLICSGQTSVNEKGEAQHLNDMGKQITLALDNVESVLNAADMALVNITRINIYTTSMDEFMANIAEFGRRFQLEKLTPAMTLVEVNRLAVPELMVEIEVNAAG